MQMNFSLQDITGTPSACTFDPVDLPVDLIGFTFAHEMNGNPPKARVKDPPQEQEQFKIEYVHGGDGLADYATILEAYNRARRQWN